MPDQDVNFDVILGELTELETQLTTTQTELSQSLAGEGVPRCSAAEGGSDTIQAELDALAAEITLGLSNKKTNGQLLVPGTSLFREDGGWRWRLIFFFFTIRHYNNNNKGKEEEETIVAFLSAIPIITGLKRSLNTV